MQAKLSFFLFLMLLLTPSVIFSQGTTDIYLIQVKMDNGKYFFCNALKLNKSPGYNNQPAFQPDGNAVFYASGAGTNTDIFCYDITTEKTRRLTDTPDSEYSPTITPNGDKFSVIQLVTTEGPRKGAQPLLAFPLEGGEPELIYEDGKKVGYHAWITSKKVALFILGSPNYLQIFDLKNQLSIHVADNIGRSIYKIPGQNAISFSQSQEGKSELIMRYDLRAETIKPLAPMLEGNGFYAWKSSDVLIMGVGAELYQFKLGQTKEWQLIGELSSFGIKKISRLAVGPKEKWIAVVTQD